MPTRCAISKIFYLRSTFAHPPMMLRPRHIALALALLLCMGAAGLWAQPHGSTHGVAGVSGAGAATYTIP
ncbi:MAG: hypothetical protein IJU72_06385, partial [Bacteroidales bacterium]|nr:hypothetical protein [Bacteroidales bacterium]